VEKIKGNGKEHEGGKMKEKVRRTKKEQGLWMVLIAVLVLSISSSMDFQR